MAEGPNGQMANLHLDEVTGERVSKTELKRRQKQRDIEEKKRAKAAAATSSSSDPLVSAQKHKASAEEMENDLNPNQYFEIRSERIKKLKQSRNPDPYPHKFHVKTDLRQFLEEYSSLKRGEVLTDVPIQLGGRIYTKRASGSKLFFYDIRSNGYRVQVMCQAQEATGSTPFEEQHEILRRGDIVGIIGFPGRTAPKNREDGELSIFAREVVLLAPCLHQIPSEHYGFRDPEQRFRQRYLDFIMNEHSRDTIKRRGEIVDYIRRYFCDNNFLEVETPTMSVIAGGATAKPFKTHLNDLHMDLFMRIAPELWLKQLLVGGFDSVFEIGVNYRNEGLDLTHNPAFTTCEFYESFADLYDVMNRTEELLSGLVKKVFGTNETKYHTQSGEEYVINWATPFKRIEMIPELEKICGEKFPPGEELHTPETGEFLKRMLAKMNTECTPPLTNARMLDKLVGDFIEDQCINPTFITGHPQFMSPLAKYHRDIPGVCERAELFVATKEQANMYTELNDPFDQRLRFEEQARQKAQGDDEAQLIDENFCSSLEHALPPTGGWGMGIDRLVMLLTDNYSIKEVTTFPLMKEEHVERTSAAEVTGVEPLPVEEVTHANTSARMIASRSNVKEGGTGETEVEKLRRENAALKAELENLKKDKS